jgi:hypothetical protein
MGLFAVPGAAVWTAQAGLKREQLCEPFAG